MRMRVMLRMQQFGLVAHGPTSFKTVRKRKEQHTHPRTKLHRLYKSEWQTIERHAKHGDT